MAEMIRKYRKEARISQQSLAGQLHVTRNTIINWESGRYRPDADLFPPLCSILGITLNDLFGISSGPSGSFSVHEQELIRQYRMISPVGRRIVDRMLGDILEEEITEKNRAINDAALGVAVISTRAAAGDGFNYSDIPVEDYRFFYANGRNKKADAVIQVKGDSMLPVYRENDWVYVQYTAYASVGEDVICSSQAGMHIKRLGEQGPYSLNTMCVLSGEFLVLSTPGPIFQVRRTTRSSWTCVVMRSGTSAKSTVLITNPSEEGQKNVYQILCRIIPGAPSHHRGCPPFLPCGQNGSSPGAPCREGG